MLELGSPVGIRSEELNETALHAAAWYGHADVIELLHPAVLELLA